MGLVASLSGCTGDTDGTNEDEEPEDEEPEDENDDLEEEDGADAEQEAEPDDEVEEAAEEADAPEDVEGDEDQDPEAALEAQEPGQDITDFNGLVINEYELVIEEDEYYDTIYVEGIVENTDGEQFSQVQVRVRVYDADGNQLDSYSDFTSDLDTGGTWAFEVAIFEEADDIDDFDIAVTGYQW